MLKGATEGFSGSLSTTVSGTKTNSTDYSTQSVAGNLSAGKGINLTSGGKIKQQGTNLFSEAGDINYTARDVEILAGVNTSNGHSSSSSYSGTLSYSTTGSVNASGSEDSSSSKYNGNTHINSQISAQGGSVNINSASDLKVVGANILANDIKLDVAGKTTIESAVDTYTSSSKGSGTSAGVGTSGSVSGGFNQSAGNTSIASVGSQTSIIGTNSVSGKTNSLHINGGILGNINNGIDKGNMHLTAEKLTYANIQEHNTSSNSSMGLNISTNVGKGAGKGVGKDGKDVSTNVGKGAGSTLANSKGSIQATNQGRDSKGATLATLGGGTITTTNGRDAIKTAENTGPAVVVSGTSNTAGQTETTLVENGINRDTDNTTVTGKEVTTGALDVDITVDVAALVNAGKNITNLPGNLKAVGVGVVGDVYAVGMVTYATLDKEGAKKLVFGGENYLSKIDGQNVNDAEAYKQVMQDGGLSTEYMDGRAQHIDTLAGKLSGSINFWKADYMVNNNYNEASVTQFVKHVSTIAADVMDITNKFGQVIVPMEKPVTATGIIVNGIKYGSYNSVTNLLSINASKDVDEFNKNNGIESNKQLLNTVVHEVSHAFQHGIIKGSITFGTEKDKELLKGADESYGKDRKRSDRDYKGPDADPYAYNNNLLEADSRFVGGATVNNTVNKTGWRGNSPKVAKPIVSTIPKPPVPGSCVPNQVGSGR